MDVFQNLMLLWTADVHTVLLIIHGVATDDGQHIQSKIWGEIPIMQTRVEKLCRHENAEYNWDFDTMYIVIIINIILCPQVVVLVAERSFTYILFEIR